MSLPAISVSRWTSWRISIGLAAAGGLAGALVGLGLTMLGKIVAGAPPADLANYLWNAAVFASLGALLAPTVTWASLRHVPLWRVFLEPVGAALAGAGLGVALGSGVAFMLLIPAAGALAIVRLAKQAPPNSAALPAANHDSAR